MENRIAAPHQPCKAVQSSVALRDPALWSPGMHRRSPEAAEQQPPFQTAAGRVKRVPLPELPNGL